MAILGPIGAGLAVGKAIYGGIQGAQASADVDEARQGIWDIYEKQMNLLKDQTALNKRVAQSGFKQTQRQAGDVLAGADVSRLYGGQALGQGASSAIGELIDFSQQNTGLATSGTQQKMVGEGIGSILNKYQTEKQQLVATRGLAQRRYGTTMEGARTKWGQGLQQAKLGFRTGYEDLQRMREGMLTDVESEDVGFWGGFFG